jgi:hypothetical protein
LIAYQAPRRGPLEGLPHARDDINFNDLIVAAM